MAMGCGFVGLECFVLWFDFIMKHIFEERKDKCLMKKTID
jgi:hypothetical protein